MTKGNSLLAAIAILSGVALSACSDKPVKSSAPQFGDAVRNNMAAHIINPGAGSIVEPADADGVWAATTITNYRLRNIKTEPVRTSDSKQ